MQRLRPTLIALAILVLSATAVFAATPGRPAFATETAEATKAAEPSDGAEASHPVNHGCVVSLAAKTATPSGFKNHGQWVSSIAKDNHGHNQGGDANTCTLPTGSPAPPASANPTKK
jgi:hypothetical protein